jgi:hypothetical protein
MLLFVEELPPTEEFLHENFVAGRANPLSSIINPSHAGLSS